MHETVKIFVGKKDYPSQQALAAKREAQGWAVGLGSWSPEITDALGKSPDAVVVINGADAGLCVPNAAIEALKKGATYVVIPLPQIKTANEGTDPYRVRAEQVAVRLNKFGQLDDARLIVTPTHIWEAAKAEMKQKKERKRFRGHVRK